MHQPQYPFWLPVEKRHGHVMRQKWADVHRSPRDWALTQIARTNIAGDAVEPIIGRWEKIYGSPADDFAIRSRKTLANQWLESFLSSDAVAGLPGRFCIQSRNGYVHLDDETIADIAQEIADCAFAGRWPVEPDFDLAAIVHQYGCTLPPVKTAPDGQPELQIRHDETARARAIDAGYWRRKIKRLHARCIESLYINAGHVSRASAPYVSDRLISVISARRRRNRQILESLIATNELGQEFSLQELSDVGISNPLIKRAELMVRIKGLEQWAQGRGHVGQFLTLTAPGFMHPILSRGGFNPNYQQTTPRQVHDYLNGVWARTRAAWARAGIAPYGVRTVEPHHDGTPHWHLLLFVDPARSDEMLEIFRAYALEESPNEKGAAEYRFKHVPIDPEKGSAAGYVAKYVAKNIDGCTADGSAIEELDFDSGRSLSDSAVRVTAWASLHGIRQFQFIGTSAISIWRELRRLTPDQVCEGLRDFVQAADESDYCRFIELLGGEHVSRDEMPLALLRDAGVGRYGDDVKRIKGISFCATGEAFISRVHEWVIDRPLAGKSSAGRRPVEDLSRPWTRVNNCTALQVEQMEKQISLKTQSQYGLTVPSMAWDHPDNVFRHYMQSAAIS